MDNTVSLTAQGIQKLPLKALTKRTISILTTDDNAGRLKMIKYFTENNRPQFSLLLQIPVSDRLPSLVDKIGFADTGKILMAEITKFQLCFNVVRPMCDDQIAQCAIAIIQTSSEDCLSLEDIILFFEGAKQAKYGKVYDRLDQQVIFEMLDVYREQRHRSFISHKDEEHAQHGCSAIDTRFVEDAIKSEKDQIRSAHIDFLREKFKVQPDE